MLFEKASSSSVYENGQVKRSRGSGEDNDELDHQSTRSSVSSSSSINTPRSLSASPSSPIMAPSANLYECHEFKKFKRKHDMISPIRYFVAHKLSTLVKTLFKSRSPMKLEYDQEMARNNEVISSDPSSYMMSSSGHHHHHSYHQYESAQQVIDQSQGTAITTTGAYANSSNTSSSSYCQSPSNSYHPQSQQTSQHHSYYADNEYNTGFNHHQQSAEYMAYNYQQSSSYEVNGYYNSTNSAAYPTDSYEYNTNGYYYQRAEYESNGPSTMPVGAYYSDYYHSAADAAQFYDQNEGVILSNGQLNYNERSAVNTEANMNLSGQVATDQHRSRGRGRGRAAGTSATPGCNKLGRRKMMTSSTPTPKPGKNFMKQFSNNSVAETISNSSIVHQASTSSSSPPPPSSSRARSCSLLSTSSCDETSFSSQSVSGGKSSNGKKKRKRILNKLQRQEATLREKRRMLKLNKAFEELRKVLPITEFAKNKLSRAETLKSAIEYIEKLSELLEII